MTTPWGRTVSRWKRYLKMMRLEFLLRSKISREKDEKKRMKKVRWSKQEKWKKRKQLYKTTLSIGGCRITAIQDLMTGKSVHVFLHGTKNWKYDFQCRHFTSKQSKVNAPWYLGELGWVDLNPLLLMMQIYLNWATHFLTSSSLNPSRLQIPPYSFPMSIYIFDAK